MPSSKIKLAIAQVLKDQGYIDQFDVSTEDGKSSLRISLKYYQGRPVIDRIERVSKPGLRVYRGKDELPAILGGLGVAIISTSAWRDDGSRSPRRRPRRRSALHRLLMHRSACNLKSA